MSALNAILLVGALSLLPRGLREAVSVKITEKTTVIKKKTNEKAYLIISKNVCVVSLWSRSCFDPVLNNRRSFDNIYVVIREFQIRVYREPLTAVCGYPFGVLRSKIIRFRLVVN